MRSIAISLLVLSLIFLAACGGEEKATSGNSGTSGNNVPETPENPAVNVGGGGTPAALADTMTVVVDVEGMT